MEPETVGQTAYAAYRESTGGRTFDGRVMPLWLELPPHIRCAWETAAHRVRRDTLREVIAGLEQIHQEMGL